MNKTAVIYWSGTGNTEMMAKAIHEGLLSAGAEADLFSVDQITPDKALAYDALALGCPSMGAEVLEEAEFEPFIEELEKGMSGKKAAIFGSYGWGDGEWMRSWKERCDNMSINLIDDGLMAHETPGAEDLDSCKKLGVALATY